jgi:hypothetical protein
VGRPRNFIGQEDYPYASVFDPTGGIRDGFALIGQPDTLFFDSAGRRVEVWSGAIGYPELISRIEKTIAR